MFSYLCFYLIYFSTCISRLNALLQVFCNFDNGDGRVVIMQQKYGRQTFALPYQRYLYGFGSAASGDVWMGLIRMKQLTDAGSSDSVGSFGDRYSVYRFKHLMRLKCFSA